MSLSHCVRSLFHIHYVGVFTRRFCQLDFPCETKDMDMKIIGLATAGKNRMRNETTGETEKRDEGTTRTTKRKTATKNETTRRDG